MHVSVCGMVACGMEQDDQYPSVAVVCRAHTEGGRREHGVLGLAFGVLGLAFGAFGLATAATIIVAVGIRR